MELEELARKYALRNAVEHGGESDPGAVIGKIMAEEDFDPGEVQEIAGKICGEINSMSQKEQAKELEKYEFEKEEEEHDPIPDLKDAEQAEAVVRFAPNPNGAPHIGHARGMIINGELKQKYDGELILRFDDTDPRTKRPLKNEEYDAYRMIEEDYRWLGYEPDRVVKSSERFDIYIEYAEDLIEKEKAYVCFCDQEKASELRSKGEACPHRDQSEEETIESWEEMREGEIAEGEAVLKIKTDLDHKNPAIRDFVAFRIIEDPDHPITGDKYRVWPMLDFQGAIEDQELGTTHIVRGKELRASTKRQKYIYDYFGWDYPEVKYWGKVQISGFNTPVSGSELKEMIESGELEGWNDVRAPTLKALKKRGFRPEAIRNFFSKMGVTENDIDASVENLESENRNIVEEKADRYFFVRNPVELEIEGVPEKAEPEMPLHPDYPERGTRSPELERDGETARVLIEKEDLEEGFLRLKGFCNIEITDPDEGKTEFVEGDHTVAVERDAPIIHWTPTLGEEATVKMPNGTNYQGILEQNEIEVDQVVQFERFGFVRKDADGKFYYAHE
ncbi:MAG: glutamate--tRNA ligase [Candidatus Nanohaloarchaea archaeon]